MVVPIRNLIAICVEVAMAVLEVPCPSVATTLSLAKLTTNIVGPHVSGIPYVSGWG
jgi:hypothetical protein